MIDRLAVQITDSLINDKKYSLVAVWILLELAQVCQNDFIGINNVFIVYSNKILP